MKTFVAFVLIFVAFACKQKYTTATTAALKKNYESLSTKSAGFPSGRAYYCFENYDAASIIDTFRNIHRQIFPGNFPFEQLNEDITKWLRDSVFIMQPFSKKGTLIVDSVNLEKIKHSFDHYVYAKKIPQEDLYSKLLWLEKSLHKATINGQHIYYNIIPYNRGFVNHTGEFSIEAGGLYGGRLYSGEPITDIIRYKCKRYVIDWYFTIGSDYFFNDQLAFSITDTCSFYSGYFFPKEPADSLDVKP